MPSLDVVSRIDFAELENAINNYKKMLAARFDFRGVHAEIELDQKEKKLKFVTTDDMKMRALQELFQSATMRRGISPKCFDWKEPEHGAGGMLKREVKIRQGLEQEHAKKISKLVKDSGLKVQPSIQGEEVRLTGKQIDDLRACMKLLDGSDLPVPLQYVNMKS